MTDTTSLNNKSPDQIVCYICNGRGLRYIKQINCGYKEWIDVSCNTCRGLGHINKSKRKSIDGTYRSKVTKSYPNFHAIGPLPRGEECGEKVVLNSNEELCYLLGHWKLFQRIDRHRYSTDDLVTSWLAIKQSKIFHLQRPVCLDIGCGIGSVLLSNAWQLPTSICYGVEVQKERYDMAMKSINYNLGTYNIHQSRVNAFNIDLRDIDTIKSQIGISYYDIITGTPPYFQPDKIKSQPNCTESLGCLFEMKGNIYDYCRTAAQLLRPPPTTISNKYTSISPSSDEIVTKNEILCVNGLGGHCDINNHTSNCSNSNSNSSSSSSNISIDVSSLQAPSIFIVVHSSLHSDDTYLASYDANMMIIKRLDVIPRVGKPPLFSVFVMVLNDWIHQSDENMITEICPSLDPTCKNTQNFTREWLQHRINHRICTDMTIKGTGRVETSIYGELIETICVRNNDGSHTLEYNNLLHSLNKPSSYDREIYDPKQVTT